MTARQRTAIDLFGGCGGLTAGLKRAGFRVISSVEIDPLAVATYSVNHPEVKLWNRDIRKLSSCDFLTQSIESIDLVAGCPPCQGFSRVRRRNRPRARRDGRNSLILDFQRVVEDLRPRAVFMENVPGIERDYRFKRFVDRLVELGYLVRWELVQLFCHGIPQRRNRVVLLAGKGFTVPEPHKLSSHPTVRRAIGSLPCPSKSRNPLHKFITLHSPTTLARIRAVPRNGGSRSAWSEEMRLQCHRSSDGFKDVYGRMAWDEPAPTITGGCINASKGRFLHPTQNRAITLLEAAILQTFPRSYYFDLTKGRYAAAEMIGNALPPRFAERLGRVILAALEKYCDD